MAARCVKFLAVAALTTFAVVAAEDLSTVVTNIARDLLYDENGKLSTHYLVYPAACAIELPLAQESFHSVGLAGDAYDKVFADHDATSCPAACIEKGVDRNYAQAIMPHRYYTADDTQTIPFDTWFRETCVRVEVCMLNYYDKVTPINIYWLDETTGTKTLHLEIGYGEQKTRCFNSYIGHTFVAESADAVPIGQITIDAITTIAFGEAPPSGGDRKGLNFDDEIKR
jgi:hypothetical protein